jgi:hypothetical protein
VENRPTSIPGGRRAQRNVAEHEFSEGSLESLATPTAAKRRQRGGRRRQQHLSATPSGSPDDSKNSVAAEELGEPHQQDEIKHCDSGPSSHGSNFRTPWSKLAQRIETLESDLSHLGAVLRTGGGECSENEFYSVTVKSAAAQTEGSFPPCCNVVMSWSPVNAAPATHRQLRGQVSDAAGEGSLPPSIEHSTQLN